MSWLLHWGERVNWTPVAFLGGAAGLLFLTRFLTVWFWWRRIRKAQGAAEPGMEETELERIAAECLDPRTHPVPIFVSFLYSLACVLFAAITIWGTVSTAWWALLVGLLAWILVHVPFRESMAELNQLQRLSALLFRAEPFAADASRQPEDE
jgi:hypothetical protein